jgi:hypothetical protein
LSADSYKIPAQRQAVNVVRNIMATTLIKTLLYLFILFALSARLTFLIAFFYSQHDTFVSIGIIIGIIALLLGLTFLIVSIFKGIKKNLKGFFILIATLLILYFFPFEYVFGWAFHQFNRADRNVLVGNLNSGKYDSLISNDKSFIYGTWVTKEPRIKVFKDSSLQMIFITQGDISSYEYYGTLFVSDITKTNNRNLSQFLHGEFNKWSLGNNWYLVECYVDTTPAP